jgi:hypothetical protein
VLVRRKRFGYRYPEKLPPDATYTITVFNSPDVREAVARGLMSEGSTVSLEDKLASAVFRYRRKE